MPQRVLQVTAGGRIPLHVGPVAEVELLGYLGGGTFGSVWKVAEVATGRLYTLKIIQNLQPGSVLVERVRLEAEVAVPSDHVVRVIGLREWDPGTFFILFEYFEAKSLDHVLAAGALTGEQRRRVFEQILLGVADAHYCNIIHRDLKPANILVGDDGRVKIIDFGISKFKGRVLTRTGDLMGTVQYMGFEMFEEGAKAADARADIYALGHIFYELAMGQHFWARRGWRELRDFVAYLQQQPPPAEAIDLSDFHCDFYPQAARVLARMVKIDPAERYGAVDEILADLGHAPTLMAPPADLRLRHPLLIVESGDNRQARTLLNLADGGHMTVGRADIAGDDDSLSRRHLKFSRAGDRYFVEDVGSRNGTLVRGAALTPGGPPVELRHADRIKAGDVFLRFVFLPDV